MRMRFQNLRMIIPDGLFDEGGTLKTGRIDLNTTGDSFDIQRDRNDAVTPSACCQSCKNKRRKREVTFKADFGHPRGDHVIRGREDTGR